MTVPSSKTPGPRTAGQVVVRYMALVLGISLPSTALAFWLGGEQTFDKPLPLAVLLITIWSPNVAAWVRRWKDEEIATPRRDKHMPSLPALLLALMPQALIPPLWTGLAAERPLPLPQWGLLVMRNLVMGPLGEEFGWRGYLLPRLTRRLGIRMAALLVGALWALWHGPLWFLPSPHRGIPYGVFFLGVMCFSVILAYHWHVGRKSVWPAVIFHLAVNVLVGALEASGRLNAPRAYAALLPFYGLWALASWSRLGGAEEARSLAARASRRAGGTVTQRLGGIQYPTNATQR